MLINIQITSCRVPAFVYTEGWNRSSKEKDKPCKSNYSLEIMCICCSSSILCKSNTRNFKPVDLIKRWIQLHNLTSK